MKKDLALYRIKDSQDKFDSAKILFEKGKYKDSISRSYYAMFTAARAILATKDLNSAKHSGIISLFNQHFVKTGVVGNDMGKLLAEAKDIREESDYGDFIIVSEEEAKGQINNSKKFIQEIKQTLEKITSK
ncbi:HEPN domain-containing protein [bacterium]|nr:HEPN domain-containing protein [bacterium]